MNEKLTEILNLCSGPCASITDGDLKLKRIRVLAEELSKELSRGEKEKKPAKKKTPK